jgi:hypothetical protein
LFYKEIQSWHGPCYVFQCNTNPYSTTEDFAMTTTTTTTTTVDMDAATTGLVLTLKAFASANYENGYDVFIETYSDPEWVQLVRDAKGNEKKALKLMKQIVADYKEMEANTSFGDDAPSCEEVAPEEVAPEEVATEEVAPEEVAPVVASGAVRYCIGTKAAVVVPQLTLQRSSNKPVGAGWRKSAVAATNTRHIAIMALAELGETFTHEQVVQTLTSLRCGASWTVGGRISAFLAAGYLEVV